MEQTKKPLPGAVLLLAALGFVLGTCEFVIVGILPEIAEGLNTSLAAVGKLVSVFAACYAVGTPVITAATGGISRRKLLAVLMGVFLLTSAASFAAPNVAVLYATRVVAALVSGTLTAVAMLYAKEVAAPEQTARAISLVYGGFSVAAVLGVPLGTAVCQILGWRWTFAVILAMGAALLPLLLLLPFEQKPRKGKKALSAAAQRWGVLAVCLAAGVIIYALLTGYTALASNYGRVPSADTGVDPGRQLAFVFSNLPRYLAVLLYSVYRDKANLFTIGNFGWMDMTVPFVSYFAPLFLLFASGVSALEGAREKLRTAWVFLATAVLMYGFTYTGMYLTSTPVSLPEINGVQTRYLLGALFALFALASMLMGRTMALQNLRPGLPQKTPPAWRVLHYGFCFALVSALLLFQAYYIGP